MNNLGNMFSNKKTEEADINDPEEVDNVATDDDEVVDESNDEVDDDIDTDDEIASVNSNISNGLKNL